MVLSCIGSQANVRRNKQKYHITVVAVIVIVIVSVAMNRGDVGIVARLQAGLPGNRVSIRCWSERCFSFPAAPVARPASIQRAPGALFPVIERSRCEDEQ